MTQRSVGGCMPSFQVGGQGSTPCAGSSLVLTPVLYDRLKALGYDMKGYTKDSPVDPYYCGVKTGG